MDEPTVNQDEPDPRNPMEVLANAMLEVLDNEGCADVQAIVMLAKPGADKADFHNAVVAAQGYKDQQEVLIDGILHLRQVGRTIGVNLIPLAAR